MNDQFDFADAARARGQYISPTWQHQVWFPPQPQPGLLRPDSPAQPGIFGPASPAQSGRPEPNSPSATATTIEVQEENNVGKSRSPNWTDAEIRFLIAIWKDHHPISKRNNSAAWEAVAKELNQILREQGLTTVRTASQCKAKIKNLEDEYKRVKDHNNKSGNNRETFTYYEELNEILGCRAKITPKTVIECGFEDAVLPSNIPSSSRASSKSTSPTPESEEVLEELLDQESSDGEAENRSLADVLSRREPVRKKALASIPRSSKQRQQNSTESCDAGNVDIAFSESLFFKRKAGGKTAQKAPRTPNQPPVKREKKESTSPSSGNTEYFSFLNESQKRDHEFFERLAEKEGKRELKSQQMMFSLVKDVAKIFKGE